VSVSDVTARIQQLQSQFALMTGVAGASGPQVLGRTADPASFAQALTGASTTGTTASTTATSGPWTGPSVGTVSSGGASGSASGNAIVAEAKKYLGVPYVWGGTNPKTGLDCSGLVQLVYGKFGVDLPRVSYLQAREGRAVANLDQARPGDLLAFNSPVSHIGIYIGNGKMIHAPRPGTEVRIEDVYEKPTAIRRVLPDGPVVAGVSAFATGAPGALPPGTPYARLFESAASRHGVPATLLAAVAKQESAYNPSAVSPAGARGLMQLMPATARGLGVDPMDPSQAVDGAARLLGDLIDRFGQVDLALAAYNAGPGAVLRHDGIPPYPETQRYVPAVLGFQRQLEVA
jgi:cell wall-associated NlpC family hydrolase